MALLIDNFDDPYGDFDYYRSDQNAFGDAPKDTETMLEDFTRMEQAEDEPIFQLDKVPYKPADRLKQLVSSNKVVAMALVNGNIVRLEIEKPQQTTIEIALSRKPQEIPHKIFMDPTGAHLIISMLPNGENYYLHHSCRKPKLLSKMKGVLIESIAWDKSNTDPASTGIILIGGLNGSIFECVIEARDKIFSESKEKYFKIVYNVGENMAITGLQYERFPPPSPNSPPKYFVMATTPTRIYQFVGGPSFEAMFEEYVISPGFKELPGNMEHSVLQFYSEYQGMAKRFAWLTGPGLFHGALVFGSQNVGEDVMSDAELMPYPTGDTDAPLSLVVTEFHYLILYDTMLQAVSRLNGEVVFCEKFLKSQRTQIGEIRGICQDPVSSSIFVFAEHRIWTLSIYNESGNVWKLLMDKNEYEAALTYCNDNSMKKDKVWCAQADHYYSQQNYRLAASYYGKTAKSFEEITLKFIRMKEASALQTYLLTRLSNLGVDDITQKALICTWLTEIYLDELNKLEDEGRMDRVAATLDEFKSFLSDNRATLARKSITPTIKKLIESHGHMEALLFFAGLIGDHELVIAHHIQRGEYGRALGVLGEQSTADLYYKFAPTLMYHLPILTCNALMRAHILDPQYLIPALMRYDPSRNEEPGREHQAIRYLKHCVVSFKSEDPAIHNYLISLYVIEQNDKELIAFLESGNPMFDKEYALRLCMKENRYKACVHIYSAMGLYQEAVELALSEEDIKLAKENADKPEDDDELRKKLWLRIAEHEVGQKKDIKLAIEIMKECELLNIEDILPFFPDFAYIDDFKEEICHSLEDYNQRIEHLKSEMDEATMSANHLRRDIKALRNKYGFVDETQKCDQCKYPLLSRPFYLFPCQHVLHADCLMNEILKHISPKQRQQLAELELHISRAEEAYQSSSATAGEMESSEDLLTLDRLKAELDDTIASECLFCGDIMIASIDQPFTTPDEEASLWCI